MSIHTPFTTRPGILLPAARSLSPARMVRLSRFRGFRFMGHPMRRAYVLSA